MRIDSAFSRIALGLVLGVVFAGASLTASAAASTRAGDVAATRDYVQAFYALARSSHATIAPGKAALRRLVREVRAECPRAAAGSPQNQESNALSDEVIGTMTITAYRPDARSIEAFARAVEGLHWSNPRLTHIVRIYGAKFKGLMSLAPADICGDVEAWAADSFQALPESTVHFNKRYFAVTPEAEEVPLRLLAPYEGPVEVSLLRRVKQLEVPVAEAEAGAVQSWQEIVGAIGLTA